MILLLWKEKVLPKCGGNHWENVHPTVCFPTRKKASENNFLSSACFENFVIILVSSACMEKFTKYY